MIKLIALTALVGLVTMVGGTSMADAHLIARPKGDTLEHRLKSQERNMAHVRGVLAATKGIPLRWLTKEERDEIRFARAANHWLAREMKETERAIHRYSTDWRSYLLKLVGPSVYRFCALPLIGRESGGVVTKWNGGKLLSDSSTIPPGSSGAYGLGQALPRWKMAPYGRDYMTNGITQIKWMNAYVRRFGGWCAANAYQLANGYY